MELQSEKATLFRAGSNTNLQAVKEVKEIKPFPLPVRNGVVHKLELKALLRMNKYYLIVHVNDLEEDDKAFQEVYKIYSRRSYVTCKLAKSIIRHILGADTVFDIKEFKLNVENGVVYKAELRHLLNMSNYYLARHIKDLIKFDKTFDEKYQRYLKRPYMTFKLAKSFINHIHGTDTIISN